MSVIGLGKHRQALEIHSYGVYGLRHLIPWTAEQILGTGKIRFGIAIIENAYDETMQVHALPWSGSWKTNRGYWMSRALTCLVYP